MFKRENCLYHPGNPCRRIEMAYVGFDRTNRAVAGLRGESAKSLSQRRDLDWIADGVPEP